MTGCLLDRPLMQTAPVNGVCVCVCVCVGVCVCVCVLAGDSVSARVVCFSVWQFHFALYD